MLKPGGTLVYSTCAQAPEENEDIVAVAGTLSADAWESHKISNMVRADLSW